MENIYENRFDEAVGKFAYHDFVLINCPKCRKQAQVFYKNHVGVLECKHCFFKQEGRESKFRPKIDFNCPDCGNQINQNLAITNEKVEKIAISCEKCHSQHHIKPKYSEIEYIYDNKEITEPYFGCPLWLQTNFKDDILWAFNREHLEHIRKYVVAKLRERQFSGSQSLVERLPQFIKSAKNRDEILKSIAKLQSK